MHKTWDFYATGRPRERFAIFAGPPAGGHPLAAVAPAAADAGEAARADPGWPSPGTSPGRRRRSTRLGVPVSPTRSEPDSDRALQIGDEQPIT